MKYLYIAILILITGCKETEVKTEYLTEVVTETITEYVEVEPEEKTKISLSFDDGEAVEYLYNNRYLFLDRGITATMFVSRFGKLSDYEKDMLIELQDLGFEIGSHSEAHLNMVPYLVTYGVEHYITYEIERPINYLTEIGINVKSMAYPFGAFDGSVNAKVNHKYRLRSRGFDSSNGVIYNQEGHTVIAQSIDQGGLTLAQAKQAVDKLIEKKGTIYLAGHVVNETYVTRFYTPPAYLIELIDYAQSLGVEFCNFSDC